MKKIAITVSLFLTIVLPLTAVAGDMVVIKAKETTLASNPQGETTGTLKEGVMAEKIEEKEGWTKVRVEGWVANGDLLALKTEIEVKKDYREVPARKLGSMLDTYDGKKVSFKGQFGVVLKMDNRVNNYTRFTVSLVDCYIPNGDFDLIKDLKEGNPVTVYGQVKRGMGDMEWYYIKVDKVTQN